MFALEMHLVRNLRLSQIYCIEMLLSAGRPMRGYQWCNPWCRLCIRKRLVLRQKSAPEKS